MVNGLMPVVFVLKSVGKSKFMQGQQLVFFCITKTETIDSLITSNVVSHETTHTSRVYSVRYARSFTHCCWQITGNHRRIAIEEDIVRYHFIVMNIKQTHAQIGDRKNTEWKGSRLLSVNELDILQVCPVVRIYL